MTKMMRSWLLVVLAAGCGSAATENRLRPDAGGSSPTPSETPASPSPTASVSPTASASPSPTPSPTSTVCRTGTCPEGWGCLAGRCIEPTPAPNPCADDPLRRELELCPGGDCPDGVDEPGVVVQLVWDGAADLDLEVAQAGASLHDCERACWYGNCSPARYERVVPPAWCGVTMAPERQACGPETIRLPDPCDGSFDVWLLSFRDAMDGSPPADAVLRFFCDGRLAAEQTIHRPHGSLMAWKVAEVTPSTCVVTLHPDAQPEVYRKSSGRACAPAMP